MCRTRNALCFILPLSLALFLAGCASKPPAAGSGDVAPAAMKPKQTDPNAAPIPPADAQFTLYCQGLSGPTHVEQANAVKAQLIQGTSLKDWYVIHQDSESIIYYGFYRSINDPKDSKETARAQHDRKQIDALLDQAGNRVFQQAFFVEVTSPDPTAPPEWNLLNTDGFWSLQIAAYKDSPKRKEAAVQAVREARAQGIPAYYYHGETTSSVCIGVWPRGAVKEQDEATAVASDPTQDLLVLPQPLADNDRVDVRNRDGQRVRALAPKTEVIDPSLEAAIAKYPTHSVNGTVNIHQVKDQATGQMTQVEDPSFLVQIPRPKASLLRAQQPSPTLIAPPQSPTQGGGKLRTIGE